MMNGISLFFKFNYKEIAYQATVLIVLFIFFSYNQDGIENIFLNKILAPYKFAFFGNYMASAMVINYYLLPNFYYKKKPVLFFVCVAVLIALVILMDEYILEQIYFPNTRGSYFPGVLYTLLETLPIIIIMVAFKFAWDFNKKQSEIDALKALVKENELQFLKSQINPHFLFNNLNNLYSYAIENSPKTPSIIIELSSVLRHILYDCTKDFVLLSKEMEHLKNFTALNELHIEHRGHISFTTDIKSSRYYIAPLILMVFIENAFKHSTDSQSESIFIDIHVDVEEHGLLTFTCKNSFLPFQKSDNTSKGIGLNNVKKRLLLLYPKSHQLQIKNNNNVYEVILTMQLNPIAKC